MKNPAPYIRKQLVALLNNTINYNGVDVPCYEGEGEVTAYQILLREQTLNERNDKASFNDEFEQVIEVISEQKTNLNKHVDAIGESVMMLMHPSIIEDGLDDSADFQICNVTKRSQSYLWEQSGEGTFINRLILRYNFLVVIQN